MRQRLTKTHKDSQRCKSSAKVKWKQSLKSGEVYFAQRQQNAP